MKYLFLILLLALASCVPIDDTQKSGITDNQPESVVDTIKTNIKQPEKVKIVKKKIFYDDQYKPIVSGFFNVEFENGSLFIPRAAQIHYQNKFEASELGLIKTDENGQFKFSIPDPILGTKYKIWLGKTFLPDFRILPIDWQLIPTDYGEDNFLEIQIPNVKIVKKEIVYEELIGDEIGEIHGFFKLEWEDNKPYKDMDFQVGMSKHGYQGVYSGLSRGKTDADGIYRFEVKKPESIEYWFFPNGYGFYNYLAELKEYEGNDSLIIKIPKKEKDTPFCGDGHPEKTQDFDETVGGIHYCQYDYPKFDSCLGDGQSYEVGKVCYTYTTGSTVSEQGLCLRGHFCEPSLLEYLQTQSKIVVVTKKAKVNEPILIRIFDPGRTQRPANDAYLKKDGKYLSNFCNNFGTCSFNNKDKSMVGDKDGTWDGYRHLDMPGIIQQVTDFSIGFDDIEVFEQDKPYWWETRIQSPAEFPLFAIREQGNYTLEFIDMRGKRIESVPFEVANS